MTIAPQTSPTVATTQGKLRGTVEDGIAVFRGIPYAEPPVGRLRFRPPVRRAPWDGVLDATAFGACHPQDEDLIESRFMGPHEREGADCLNLNVWTPAAGATGLPVLVWLHGGSLKFGAGSQRLYDGATFARDGVVCVTINYRLHPAGFLNVGDRPGSGAFGHLDQIAALEWVAENIAAFGGDPGLVTIAGESAGAHSIGQLLAAPAARGLFRRGILQSGASSFDIPRDAAAVLGRAVLERLAVRADDDDALAAIADDDLLAAARAVEPQMVELLRSHALTPSLMGWITRVFSLTTVGGDVVPRPALEAVGDGAARGVDLLVGTNLEEATLFGPGFEAFAPEAAAAAFGDRAGDVLARYGRAHRFLTDAMFRIPAIRLAEAAQPHSPRTFMYLLTYASPASGTALGAVHALDLPFVWDRADEIADTIFEAAGKPPSPALATAMHGAWVAFATTGVPRHPGLPEWPAYGPRRRATMLLDDESRVEDDPLGDERRLWDGVRY